MIQMTVNPSLDIIPPGTMPLGFGCGGLHDGRGRRESLQLLETAMDCGITYFDTARMYGLGAAEGILGEITSRYRDHVIIATKAGILPADHSIQMRLCNRAIELLHKTVPASARYLPKPAAARLRFHAFSASALRESVETSLRQLRTDYIDILLLHECSAIDVQNQVVFEFLQALKREGKIRAFGLATGIDETIKIAATFPPLARILQIPNNIMDMNIKEVLPGFNRLTIIYSCLARALKFLIVQLSNNDKLAKKWFAMTWIDCRDTAAMAQLVLVHALRSNPRGLVLFSTSKPENIRSNVRAVTDCLIDPKQIDAFEAFIAEIVSSK